MKLHKRLRRERLSFEPMDRTKGIFLSEKSADYSYLKQFFGGIGHVEVIDSERKLISSGSFFQVFPGAFVTAAHVLKDYVEHFPSGKLQARFFLQVSDKFSMQFVMESARVTREEDIAIVFCRPMPSKFSVDLTPLQGLRISPRIPSEGETVLNIGYRPDRRSAETFLGQPTSKSIFGFVRVGTVTSVFLDGRDKTMLPGTCFEFSSETVGSMSGGPVIDRFGSVIGILSTGYDGEKISYASCLFRCMTLNLNQKWPMNETRRIVDLPIDIYLKHLLKYSDDTVSSSSITQESYDEILSLCAWHGRLPNTD